MHELDYGRGGTELGNNGHLFIQLPKETLLAYFIWISYINLTGLREENLSTSKIDTRTKPFGTVWRRVYRGGTGYANYIHGSNNSYKNFNT